VWSDVTTELADVVRVCAYDRAGDGRSDPIGPHTAGDQADDLHALLGAAGIETPVVLVGHSLPGLMLRLYPDRYPDDVAGLVFLDPLVPHIEELQLAALPQPTAEEPEALTRYRELLVKLIEENDVALPEYDNFLFNDSYAQAGAIRTLGDLPLIVVTAERDNWIGGPADDPAVQAADAILMAVQRDEHEALAGLSSAGEHRTVESGHEIPRDRPQVVVDVVLDLLSQLEQR
jgi:pimeloyl-ACP methyl ester carboxylesterase